MIKEKIDSDEKCNFILGWEKNKELRGLDKHHFKKL